MRTSIGSLLLIALVAIAAGGSPAQAGIAVTITPVVVEGDLVPGVGNVTSIDNLAVNDSGSWLVELDTNNANTEADGLLLKDGVLHIREGQALALPAGSSLDSFDAINLNNAGHSGWNFFLNGTSGTNDDSGIYLDTNLILQEFFISTSPVFTPGTRYIGFFDGKINEADKIFVVASIEDVAIPTTVDRALVVLDVTGGSLVSETVLAKEGDILAGQTDTVADFGTGPHQTAFNDAGSVLYFVDLNGLTTTDGVIYLNNTVVAQEGGPSVVPGRNYELLSSRALDLSDTGQYVFKANLDGATTDDELIVRNNTVLVREGDNLPSIGVFHFTAFGTGPVEIDNAGNALWWGDWDDPNLDKDTGLFLNDQLIVVEGQPIGGDILDEISSGEDAFKLSDDGHWILFEGTFVGGLSAAILIQVEDPTVPVRIEDLSAQATEDGVRLAWALSDPEHELASIDIERAGAEVGPWTVAGSVAVESEGAMGFVDTGARLGETIWYRLALRTTDGDRSFTQPISIATSQRLASGLQSAIESADGSVRVQWAASRSGSPVRVAVHDARGRRVWETSVVAIEARSFETRWDRRDTTGERVPRGVYFVRVQVGEIATSGKLVLVRP